MSEICGISSILVASEYLSNMHGGKGVMLGGITGVTPTEVVILGANTAGECAARAAIGLGSTVKIFDNSLHQTKKISESAGTADADFCFSSAGTEKSSQVGRCSHWCNRARRSETLVLYNRGYGPQYEKRISYH